MTTIAHNLDVRGRPACHARLSGPPGTEPSWLEGRILVVMKSAHAASRRFLPGSPFNVLPVDLPVEQFTVRDQVTHDKYGLGRVISVQDDATLVIDFGACRMRITTPCSKLAKL